MLWGVTGLRQRSGCFDRVSYNGPYPGGTAKRQGAGFFKSESVKPSIHGFTRLLHPTYATEKTMKNMYCSEAFTYSSIMKRVVP